MWFQISILLLCTLLPNGLKKFFFSPSVTYYLPWSDHELVKFDNFPFHNYVEIMVQMIEEVKALNNMDTIKEEKNDYLIRRLPFLLLLYFQVPRK